MRRPFSALALSLPLLLATNAAASAACLDEVRQLAERHDISTAPPTAAPQDGKKEGPGVTTKDLAQSGGVIEPPASSDKSVISPPPSADSRMPTVPDIKPAPSPTPGIDRTTLQALLVAARAEAERGKEETCREGLEKARKLAAQKP